MINPIIPYGIKGVLWYQGCQNQGTSATPYLGMQEALISDWRTRWGIDDLPFIVTQLCTWSSGTGFPAIRDQQLALRDTTENVGVVSIMDLGDVDGTIGDNIHPIEKKEVARRISLAAKAIAYNDTNVRYRFPVLDGYTVNSDGTVTVTFKDVYDGLILPNGQTNVNGFKILSGGTEIDNTVMVPVRPILELFGFKVTWDAKRQYIKSNTVLGRVQMAIGSTYVSLNDYQAYILNTYPRLYNGTSLIPVEFAQSCTDSSIQYQKDNNALVIASK